MSVAVFGASGVVGRTAAAHFAGIADEGVLAVSRRPPDRAGGGPGAGRGRSCARRSSTASPSGARTSCRPSGCSPRWSAPGVAPLPFPGGGRSVQEAVDARLLARALAWAATTPEACGESFNVTNGDVYDWHDMWPVLAGCFGMEVGEPAPQQLAETMPARAAEWAAIVDAQGLTSPRSMPDFVGSAWQYADALFGARGTRSLPALLSTVKLRQAGFGDCIDTEDMFRDWIGELQRRRVLPGP